jgi:hypothetical protein
MTMNKKRSRKITLKNVVYRFMITPYTGSLIVEN